MSFYSDYLKSYYKKKPWMLFGKNARDRCNRIYWYKIKNIKFLMTSKELEKLWLLCNANKLKKPSLHRKDSRFDYVFNNCEFIELDKHYEIHAIERRKYY